MALVSRQNVIDALGDTINDSVGGQVGNRVYNSTEGPQDGTLSYILFFGVGDVPNYYLGGCENLDSDFQISIFGKKELGNEALRDIADDLINDMDRITGVPDIDGYTNEIITFTNAGVNRVEGEYRHHRMENNIKGFLPGNIS